MAIFQKPVKVVTVDDLLLAGKVGKSTSKEKSVVKKTTEESLLFKDAKINMVVCNNEPINVGVLSLREPENLIKTSIPTTLVDDEFPGSRILWL